jgi:hypothetical protein
VCQAAKGAGSRAVNRPSYRGIGRAGRGAHEARVPRGGGAGLGAPVQSLRVRPLGRRSGGAAILGACERIAHPGAVMRPPGGEEVRSYSRSKV